MSESPLTDRPWWQMSLLTWLGLVTLATVSIGLSTGLIPFQPQTAAWFLYTIDPRYWPLWVAYILWGAACWRLLDLPYCPDVIRRDGNKIKSLIVLAVFLLIAIQNGWQKFAIEILTKNWLYYGVYEPYIMGPISHFMVNGYWDWKTFISPILGLILFGTMIRLMMYLRKKGNVQDAKTDK